MFDLKPRVHFDEEELVVLKEELDRADAEVADGADRIDHHLADPGAGCGVDDRGGRFLKHLLMAAL